MELEKAQRFTARVSDKYFVSDNNRFLCVKFELVLPDRITFFAGQYGSIKINENGERRSYSFLSTPDNNHGFQILAEIVENGKGSNFLRDIKIGEVVDVLAPLGRFVVKPSGNKLLFVATGSGIVPIMSMINDLLITRREKKSMRLHWGMKSEQDLFFIDNLERLAEAHPNFVYDIVLSRGSEEWELCRGHVQDCLRRDFASMSDELKGWDGYLCGHPDKVLAISETLKELGMQADNIVHEKFS